MGNRPSRHLVSDFSYDVQGENQRMSEAVIAMTTLPADLDATPIAKELVGSGLAACVNIVPGVSSVYTWKGVPQVDREQQLIIKTTDRSRRCAYGRRSAPHIPTTTPSSSSCPSSAAARNTSTGSRRAWRRGRKVRSQKSKVRSWPQERFRRFLSSPITTGIIDTATMPSRDQREVVLDDRDVAEGEAGADAEHDPARRRPRRCRPRTTPASSAPRRRRTARTSGRWARTGPESRPCRRIARRRRAPAPGGRWLSSAVQPARSVGRAERCAGRSGGRWRN